MKVRIMGREVEIDEGRIVAGYGQTVEGKTADRGQVYRVRGGVERHAKDGQSLMGQSQTKRVALSGSVGVARNKAMPRRDGAGTDTGDCSTAGRGEAYSPEIRQSLQQRALEHPRRSGAGANPAPAPPSQSFFIPGRLPGLNEILSAAVRRRGKWNAYDDMKRSYGEYVQATIRLHKLQPMQRVSVAFEWVEQNQKRDKDNVAVAKKFVLDALVTMKVIPNDGWKNVEGFSDSFTVDRANPGVRVILKGVEPCKSKSK